MGINEIGASDPLAGLDAIDWAELTHAYGSAEDVPGQLRALRSPDEEARRTAFGKLYGNIFHQGSRYEATSYAVPFLVGMAVAPDTPDRDLLLWLLGAIAIGHDESWLPQAVDIVRWRTHVAETKATSPEEAQRKMDAWVEEAPDENERRSREFWRTWHSFEYELRQAVSELAAYDAVRAAVPALCGLLEDSDPGVRAGAAYVLGWFPEEAGTSLPALLRAAAAEPNAVIAVGLVGDASHVAPLRPFLRGQDPALRCAAALALARLGVTEAEVIGELAVAAANPPDDHWLVFFEGDLRGYASATLAGLDGQVGAEAVDAVLDGLAQTSETGSFAPTAAALRLVFGERAPQPLPPFGKLDEPQRRAVRVLAELDPQTWQWINFMEILGRWGLPAVHEELRTYAELPAAH
ncbi:HEAT repeat-containing protein [Thermomonospora echinospora]|uniref:HEAT repeat-containing protein n=1 Tax=Thermomonospora echinospora TaxID=1992 RepID=A0A1H5VWE4_9ACTN|nr:HEAT repeat domain-containing protein [Thermomonospora echinospora]SEF91181.1 HEAT repeat-containing protein [Thermomonospora echinospora]